MLDGQTANGKAHMSLDVVKRYDELYTDDAPMKAKEPSLQRPFDL